MLTYKYLKYKNKYIKKKNNDKLNVVGGGGTEEEKKPYGKLFDILTNLSFWNKPEPEPKPKPKPEPNDSNIEDSLKLLLDILQVKYDSAQIISHSIDKHANEYNTKIKLNKNKNKYEDLHIHIKLYLLLISIQQKPDCDNSSHSLCHNFIVNESESMIIISFKGSNKIDTILSFEQPLYREFYQEIIGPRFYNREKTYFITGMNIVCKHLAANNYFLFKLLIDRMNQKKKIYLAGHSFGGISALYIHIILTFLFRYRNLETYIFGGFPIIPNHLKNEVELHNLYYIINEYDPICQINEISLNVIFDLISLPRINNIYCLTKEQIINTYSYIYKSKKYSYVKSDNRFRPAREKFWDKFGEDIYKSIFSKESYERMFSHFNLDLGQIYPTSYEKHNQWKYEIMLNNIILEDINSLFQEDVIILKNILDPNYTYYYLINDYNINIIVVLAIYEITKIIITDNIIYEIYKTYFKKMNENPTIYAVPPNIRLPDELKIKPPNIRLQDELKINRTIINI